MDTFGDRLKAMRIAAGITQAQLAEMSGIPLGTIREYEQTRREPLLSKAGKLARALKRPLEAFLPDDGEGAAPVKLSGRPRKQTGGKVPPSAKGAGKRKNPAAPQGRRRNPSVEG